MRPLYQMEKYVALQLAPMSCDATPHSPITSSSCTPTKCAAGSPANAAGRPKPHVFLKRPFETLSKFASHPQGKGGVGNRPGRPTRQRGAPPAGLGDEELRAAPPACADAGSPLPPRSRSV